MVTGGRGKRGIEPLIAKEIRTQADEPQQKPRDEGSDNSDHNRQERNGNHLRRSGEVAQFLQVFSSVFTHMAFFLSDSARSESFRTARKARERAGPEVFNSCKCKIDSPCKSWSPCGVNSTKTSRLSSSLCRRTTAPLSTSRSTSSTVL